MIQASIRDLRSLLKVVKHYHNYGFGELDFGVLKVPETLPNVAWFCGSCAKVVGFVVNNKNKFSCYKNGPKWIE